MKELARFVFILLLFLCVFCVGLLTASAQEVTPSNELSRDCYTLGTSTITFAEDFKTRCRDANGVTNNFVSNHSYPTGTFIADQVIDLSGTTQNLKCNAPDSCVYGFGSTPVPGSVRQYRFANTFLGSPYLTITIQYEDGQFLPFFFTEFNTLPDIAPIDYETRFFDVSVSGTSTSIVFEADYFLNLDEYNANNRPDYVRVIVYDDGLFFDDFVGETAAFLLPLTNGTNTKSIPYEDTLGNGDYFAYFNFYNVNSNTATFVRSQAVLSFEIAGNEVVFQSIEEMTNGLGVSQNTFYEDCGLNNIFGCIKNAFIWAFIPQESIFDRFASLYTRIETKPPFGYLTATKNALLGVNSSSTPAFSFGNIPFVDTIFDPLKVLMAIAFWVIYAFFFIGRLDKIDL